MNVTSSASQADLRRFLIAEMAIGAAVNGAITAGLAWLIFSGRQSVPVWGNGGLVFDLLPSSALPVLAMGLIVPAVLRKRLGKGERLPTCDLGRWSRLLPCGVIARAVLLAVVWAALFMPAGTVVLWIGNWSEAPVWGVLLGKTLFGSLVGGSAVPFIVLPALVSLANGQSTPECKLPTR